MEKQTTFKGTEIVYTVNGKAENTLVFLHGYLEAKEIWTEFVNILEKEYTVITIDMLGHGKSGTISDEHSMKLMAESVKLVLDTENIETCTIFGHSMGGYISLEFAKNYGNMLNGLCLFHSQAHADTEEKRKNRDREISLVKIGKYAQIIATNIPNMYADGINTKFAEKLEFSKNIAKNIKPEGVIAALNGMKNREKNIDVLRNYKKPILFIAGKKDNLIPYNPDDEQLSVNPNMEIVVLENSGHMGMFEESEKSINAIEKFIKTCM